MAVQQQLSFSLFSADYFLEKCCIYMSCVAPGKCAASAKCKKEFLHNLCCEENWRSSSSHSSSTTVHGDFTHYALEAVAKIRFNHQLTLNQNPHTCIFAAEGALYKITASVVYATNSTC